MLAAPVQIETPDARSSSRGAVDSYPAPSRHAVVRGRPSIVG